MAKAIAETTGRPPEFTAPNHEADAVDQVTYGALLGARFPSALALKLLERMKQQATTESVFFFVGPEVACG